MTSNLTPYKMKGPRPMVPQWPPSSDMAQLTSCLCSTFGFFCCLLFLPASWEAGANTFQELQKSGELSTSHHLLPITPDLPHRTPSAHIDLNPGQRPPDLSTSASTKKPKKKCKPAYKPTDNSKATGHQNGTVHREITPTVEKDANNQKRDPVIRNGRSADDPQPRSQSTSAPRRTTCRSTTGKTRVTRNSGTPERPVDTSTRLRTTPQKPTPASHHSEVSRKATSSLVKSSEAPRTSSRTPRTPATSGAEDHRTSFVSDKPVQTTRERIKETTSASEETTRPQVTPAEHEGDNVSANERITRPQVTPAEHEGDNVSASERTTRSQATATQYERETLSASERTTRPQVTMAEQEGDNVSASERTTRSQATATQYERETLSANERTTRSHVTRTEHEGDSVSASERTTRSHVTMAEQEGDNVSANERTTRPQATASQYERETLSANERTTQAQVMSTDYERENISANRKTTRPQATSTEYGGETVSAEETTAVQVIPIEPDTTSANEKTTQVSVQSPEHPEEATSATQKATKVSESPTVFSRKTTVATKTTKATGNLEKTVAVLVTTRPPVKATEDKSTAVSLHLHKTETAHQGLIGSVTTRTNLGHISSEAQHPQQNIHSSPGSVHAALAGESNSFPAWAIVIVILMAVIVLLISIGLIFLVACASRTRHVLAQNSEDADPEDRGGRNSYPVYLMEQQNLKPNQIPSPP